MVTGAAAGLVTLAVFRASLLADFFLTDFFADFFLAAVFQADFFATAFFFLVVFFLANFRIALLLPIVFLFLPAFFFDLRFVAITASYTKVKHGATHAATFDNHLTTICYSCFADSPRRGSAGTVPVYSRHSFALNLLARPRLRTHPVAFSCPFQ